MGALNFIGYLLANFHLALYAKYLGRGPIAFNLFFVAVKKP